MSTGTDDGESRHTGLVPLDCAFTASSDTRSFRRVQRSWHSAMPINPAETRVSLDGYRIQVLEKLRSCRDSRKAREILAEADVILNASGLSRPAQRAFWEGLNTDLDMLVEEPTDALTAIVAAAKADIAKYLRLIPS